MGILEWASEAENAAEMAEIRRLFRCSPVEAAMLLMLGQVSESLAAWEMVAWGGTAEDEEEEET